MAINPLPPKWRMLEKLLYSWGMSRFKEGREGARERSAVRSGSSSQKGNDRDSHHRERGEKCPKSKKKKSVERGLPKKSFDHGEGGKQNGDQAGTGGHMQGLGDKRVP